MLLFVISFACWAAFIQILYTLWCWYGGEVACGALAAYICCTSIATFRLWQWRWLRQSALAHALHSWLTDGRQSVYDARKPTKRPTLFAVEPHGAVCYGMSVQFGPTVDSSEKATRVRMMAHPTFQYVPFARELYMAFGVVPAKRAFFELLVSRKESVALIPSGIVGMQHALLEQNDANMIVVYRPRKTPSCFELAHKHKMLVVPVLSCNERHMQLRWTLFERWPIVSTLFWGFRRQPVMTVTGAPLDTATFETVDALVDAYYKSLMELAVSVKKPIWVFTPSAARP